MKTILTLVMAFFSLTAISQTKTNKLLASCCTKTEGRCTGSASCSACTNCSRCAHCSNGGSCGVCGGGSTQTFYKSKPKTQSVSRKPAKSYSTVDSRSSYHSDSSGLDISYEEDQMLTTTIEGVNLRQGPGTNFEILEKLAEFEIVIFKGQIGEWIQVEVKSTEIVGYIFFKYLN